ncbi:uncharacterized protein METZ01_LOCUS214209, partial [marine metagenome]
MSISNSVWPTDNRSLGEHGVYHNLIYFSRIVDLT